MAAREWRGRRVAAEGTGQRGGAGGGRLIGIGGTGGAGGSSATGFGGDGGAGGAGGWLWARRDGGIGGASTFAALPASRVGRTGGAGGAGGAGGLFGSADWAGRGKRIDRRRRRRLRGTGAPAGRRHGGCSPDWSAAPAGTRSRRCGCLGVRRRRRLRLVSGSQRFPTVNPTGMLIGSGGAGGVGGTGAVGAGAWVVGAGTAAPVRNGGTAERRHRPGAFGGNGGNGGGALLFGNGATGQRRRGLGSGFGGIGGLPGCCSAPKDSTVEILIYAAAFSAARDRDWQ
ncbi:hypothetical protein BZL29_8515 [Mycobacterium kansasii]|uniref:Uncharacterized protein n=1 Tax=Mycobacterium kansasii TaxID=1768 RepID=A0A1V3W9Q9_MYCKA|nr:hypothetical protein BZL29_8515 [Mycobacterium kansasii]